jgi:hypothetical protein
MCRFSGPTRWEAASMTFEVNVIFYPTRALTGRAD